MMLTDAKQKRAYCESILVTTLKNCDNVVDKCRENVDIFWTFFSTFLDIFRRFRAF